MLAIENKPKKFVKYTGINYFKTRIRLAYHPPDKQFREPIEMEFEPSVTDSSTERSKINEEEKSKQHSIYKLTRKIAKLALFISIGAGVVIAAFVLLGNIPPNDKEGDLQNWVAVIIEVAIALFLALAILIYSNSTQKEVNDIIKNTKQIMDGQMGFARTQVQSNLQGAQNILNEIGDRENAITSGDTSKYHNIERDMSVLKTALINSFKSNRYIVSTYPIAFDAFLTKEIHEVSSQGIGYCDPNDTTGIKQTFSNLKSEVGTLLGKINNLISISNKS